MNTILAELKSTTAETKAVTGSFSAILSTPSKDRDGEVVDAHAFDPLPAHLSIDVDHAMTVERTVASGVPSYDADGVLHFDGTFASTPLAQTVRTLVDEGHITSMSVAFMNALRREDENGVPHVVRAELLNAGIVAIPANRDALITASKTYVALTSTTTPSTTTNVVLLDPSSPTAKDAAAPADEPSPDAPAHAWSVTKARALDAYAAAALLD